MIKRWILMHMVGALLLVGCAQAVEMTDLPTSVPSATNTEQPTKTSNPTEIPTSTPQPTQTPEPTTSQERSSASGDSVQADLFGLVPPDALSIGYCDFQQIRADPDLVSAFELIPDICPILFSPIPGSQVDQSVSFSRRPDDSDRLMFGIIFIYVGDFSGVTLLDVVKDFLYEDPVLQEYQGVEVMVEEQAEPFDMAVTILDESTIIYGEQSGVLAALDAALSGVSSPLSELGAVLPPVPYASVLVNCPQYEALGCTGLVLYALAAGPGPDLTLLQVYQFEDPESAATALDTISADIESGLTVQFGSMKMKGETITQDGRFILVEDNLPVEDIGKLFE